MTLLFEMSATVPKKFEIPFAIYTFVVLFIMIRIYKRISNYNTFIEWLFNQIAVVVFTVISYILILDISARLLNLIIR